MGESDTRTSHLIIRIGHLMKQILTMLLKKRCVYFIFDLTLWDTAGLLVNDNYSTPTVNNIYCSSSSCTGSDTASCRTMCTVFPSRSFTAFTGPSHLLLFGPLRWCVVCDLSE